MDYIVYNYHKWRGLRVINCERCGCLAHNTNNNGKYCDKCSKIVRREKKTLNMALLRSKVI